ncbi:MAG TPA: MFS transporter [Xanthobacteraceae bacterium]|nr:MFS transporter [Xanthobacteraceae bacterium]
MDAAAPPETKPLDHAEARRIVIAMMLPVFMGSLDQTVLASALPAIGREFGNVHDLPWLITGYLIAATASTPLYGKVSDIRGRRFVLAIALCAHLAGSLMCALAPSMGVLILGRALQGLGGGGLTSTGMIVLGDVASPKDRARYYGYFSITYTTAGACAPALGGFLADYLHWSAIFWLSIPLGLTAMVVTLSAMRRLPRHDRRHRLDVLGAVLIVLATVPFMLALTSGGVRFAWTSGPIVWLFVAAAIVGAMFVVRLLTAPEPLIPLTILRDPVARSAIAINSFGWGAIVALNVYLPVYLQDVLAMSATSAGLSLMVLMGVLNASAGLASPLIARHRRYKLVPLIGLAATALAVGVLAWLAGNMTFWGFEILLAVIGIGFGPLPPLTGVALQNAVALHQFGIAVGTMNFLRSLSATVLVSIFGAITLKTTNAATSAAEFQTIFLIAAGSLTVALVAMLLLEERPLNTSHTR